MPKGSFIVERAFAPRTTSDVAEGQVAIAGGRRQSAQTLRARVHTFEVAIHPLDAVLGIPRRAGTTRPPGRID